MVYKFNFKRDVPRQKILCSSGKSITPIQANMRPVMLGISKSDKIKEALLFTRLCRIRFIRYSQWYILIWLCITTLKRFEKSNVCILCICEKTVELAMIDDRMTYLQRKWVLSYALRLPTIAGVQRSIATVVYFRMLPQRTRFCSSLLIGIGFLMIDILLFMSTLFIKLNTFCH